MTNGEFISFRRKLNRTQKEMAQLLGLSVKAVHSYEQGWRNIPPHVERQTLFLASNKQGVRDGLEPCWTRNNCPSDLKEKCPAWEFGAGKMCWFICGTICSGRVFETWREKMRVCRECEVFHSFFDHENPDA